MSSFDMNPKLYHNNYLHACYNFHLQKHGLRSVGVIVRGSVSGLFCSTHLAYRDPILPHDIILPIKVWVLCENDFVFINAFRKYPLGSTKEKPHFYVCYNCC